MTLSENPEPGRLNSSTKRESDLMKRDTFMNGLVACTVVAGIFVAGASLTSGRAFAQSTAVAATTFKGDPIRGKALYQGCESCHSIDANDVGPKHRGVVGRRAGSLKDYSYSAALKNSGLTWDDANLDRWLSNPSALVPGTKMFFKIDDAQKRADIITYLRELR
jgi:cytochrome c